MTDKAEWDNDQSPLELTRKLIEEASQWNETLVFFQRRVILNVIPVFVVFYVVYAWDLFSLLRTGGVVYLLGVVVMTPFAINGVFMLRGGYREYVKNVARRDKWRERFEILRRKEEELARLLSGKGAD